MDAQKRKGIFVSHVYFFFVIIAENEDNNDSDKCDWWIKLQKGNKTEKE